MRLHRPPNTPPQSPESSGREPGRLVFPRAALDRARRDSAQSGRPKPAAARRDVVGRIDAMLDHMQRRIDDLTADAEADAQAARLRFPVVLASSDDDGDDFTPGRAA